MDRTSAWQSFNPPVNRPSSPPATPVSSSHSQFPSTASHTSPILKRDLRPNPAQSPPLDFIEPVGQGHAFRYTRPQTQGYPHSSSSSGSADKGTPREPSPEVGTVSETSEVQRTVRARTTEHANFTLEEVSEGDMGYDSDIEVIRPDRCEDADSDPDGNVDIGAGVVDGLRKLSCEGSDDEQERLRRYQRKKKRWSAGLFKRSHSQSVGSDSDVDDADADALDAHDVGSSARRLRRRVHGPGDRSSLIFDDNPPNNIVEVEEPDDSSKDPPSRSSNTDGRSLEAMPFWVLEDPMEIDSDPSPL